MREFFDKEDEDEEVLDDKLYSIRDDFMNALFKDNANRMENIITKLGRSSREALQSVNILPKKRLSISMKYDKLRAQLQDKIKVYEAIGMPSSNNLKNKLKKIDELKSEFG